MLRKITFKNIKHLWGKNWLEIGVNISDSVFYKLLKSTKVQVYKQMLVHQRSTTNYKLYTHIISVQRINNISKFNINIIKLYFL